MKALKVTPCGSELIAPNRAITDPNTVGIEIPILPYDGVVGDIDAPVTEDVGEDVEAATVFGEAGVAF